jgi:hypothetical protein
MSVCGSSISEIIVIAESSHAGDDVLAAVDESMAPKTEKVAIVRSWRERSDLTER